jgi:nucleoside-diphosphate-sugar epimerase
VAKIQRAISLAAAVNILLIGGSGFIGPHVAANLLRRGHDVTVFHRGTTRGSAVTLPSGVFEVHGNRHQLNRSAATLRALEPDVVIDCVLSSGRQARELMATFRGAAARIVALSSCDVYRACGVLHGSEPGALDPVPLTESSPLRTSPQTYPPEQIKALQQVIGWLDDQYDKIPVEREVLGDPDLPGTVLRLPMVYGPGDRQHRLFPLVKRIDDGRPFMLFEQKHAAWRSPRGYVENVAAAIALAAVSERAAGRIYNVADGESLSELAWARCVAAATGWNGELLTLPAHETPAHLRWPGNLDQHWATDTTRIRSELGYAEPIPPDDGIRRTVDWERAHPPPIDPHAFDYGAEDVASLKSQV